MHQVHNIVARWVTFFDPSLAELALSRFISSINKVSTEDKKIASKLLLRIDTPGPILRSLASIVRLNLQIIATKSLRRWTPGRKHTSGSTGAELESWWTRLNAQETSIGLSLQDTLNLASASEGEIELFTLAAEISPSIRSQLSHQLGEVNWTNSQVERLAKLITACSRVDGALSSFDTEFWKATTDSAFEQGVSASVILVRSCLEFSGSNRQIIFARVTDLLAQRKFKPTTDNIELLNDLMVDGTADGQIEQSKLVDACVHSLVRQLSNQGVLGDDVLSLMSAFGNYVGLAQRKWILTSTICL